MDIEQYKKIVESRMKAAQIKKQVKTEIENYEDKQLGIYETSKTKYKPLIENVQEVTKTVDEKPR